MYRWMACVIFATLIAGCGGIGKKEPIALDKVPENVMAIAKKEFPAGLTMKRAVIKANGEYEIIAQDSKGKQFEIDITPDGTVTEREGFTKKQ